MIGFWFIGRQICFPQSHSKREIVASPNVFCTRRIQDDLYLFLSVSRIQAFVCVTRFFAALAISFYIFLFSFHLREYENNRRNLLVHFAPSSCIKCLQLIDSFFEIYLRLIRVNIFLFDKFLIEMCARCSQRKSAFVCFLFPSFHLLFSFFFSFFFQFVLSWQSNYSLSLTIISFRIFVFYVPNVYVPTTSRCVYAFSLCSNRTLEIIFSHRRSTNVKYQHRTTAYMHRLHWLKSSLGSGHSLFGVLGRCNNSIHSNRSSRRPSLTPSICRIAASIHSWFGSRSLPLLNNLKSISTKSNLLIYNAFRREKRFVEVEIVYTAFKLRNVPINSSLYV